MLLARLKGRLIFGGDDTSFLALVGSSLMVTPAGMGYFLLKAVASSSAGKILGVRDGVDTILLMGEPRQVGIVSFVVGVEVGVMEGVQYVVSLLRWSISVESGSN